jgi:murein DD-endopeptidase MepM/ murein hydrolase activator NlpD
MTRFLAALAGVLALAAGSASMLSCGTFSGEPDATPTVTFTPTRTPTRTPTLTPTPSSTPTPAPGVDTPALEVAQGQVAVLRVSGSAAAATAYVRGDTIRLLPRPGGFWGIIAAPAGAELGESPISILLTDSNGNQIAGLSATLIVYDTAFPIDYITLPPGQDELLDPELSEQEYAVRSSIFATYTPEILWSGAFIFPTQGIISSPFGAARSFNGGPASGAHSGTDFSVEEGTPIVAANSGRVAYASALPIRGNTVLIDHGAGVFSGYHHLQRSTVAVGQSVAQGDLVGYAGMSGLATGPHLHWEIIVRGVEVDPVFWTYGTIGP